MNYNNIKSEIIQSISNYILLFNIIIIIINLLLYNLQNFFNHLLSV